MLIGSLEVGADSSIVFVPMLIIGLGIGALASQLGNVTVSAVPTEQSSEVGGLQNTATQLGASLGTALAGSILIAALTASFLAGIEANPNVPQSMKDQANVQLAAGAPFISNADVEELMDGGRTSRRTSQDEILAQNEASQIAGLRAALVDPGRHGRHLAVLHRADTQEAAGLRSGPGRARHRPGPGMTPGLRGTPSKPMPIGREM